MKHLNEMENKGIKLKNSGHYQEAIDLFEKIIAEDPNYEWGICFFHLADCYDNLGEYENAKKYYLSSIDYDEVDLIRLGNFASFLLYHGNPQEALECYLKLIALRKRYKFDDQSEIFEILNNSSKKLVLTEDQLKKLIEQA